MTHSTYLPAETKNDVVARITTSFKKSIKALLETAKEIVEASNRDDFTSVRKELVNNRVMSESTITSFLTIGNNAVLMNPDYEDRLPPSYTSLYALAKLDNSELVSLIDGNTIHSDLTVKATQALIGSAQKKNKTPQIKPRADIHISSEIYAQYQSEIHALEAFVIENCSFLLMKVEK